MSSAALWQYAIYALIALFVIYWQLAPTPIRTGGALVLLPLAMTAYGLYTFLQAPPDAAAVYLVLAGELAVSAVAGLVRALTVWFWVDERGVAMQRAAPG